MTNRRRLGWHHATTLSLLVSPFLASCGGDTSSSDFPDSGSGDATDAGSITDATVSSDGALSDDGAANDAGDTDGSAVTCNDVGTTTQAIVAAANAFLATFADAGGDAGVGAVQFPFTRDAYATQYSGNGGRVGEQYGAARWSNYPVSDVPRPGVAYGSLSPAQQAAEDALFKVALSAEGYTKIHQIMNADQVFCNEGQQYTCGLGVYTIGIFGTPSTTAPWMIQFGGHHLGLDVVIDGTQGTVAPTLTGADPTTYTDVSGSAVRALAGESDDAFAILDSLTPAQSAQAVANYAVGNLVLGPGQFVSGTAVPTAEGVPVSSFSAAQRALVMTEIMHWAGILNSDYTCTRLAEIEAGLDQTYFFWSGPTTHDANEDAASYFRIQGPTVWLEWSPQGDVGGMTGGMDGGMPGGDGGFGGPPGDGGMGGMGGGGMMMGDGGMGGGGTTSSSDGGVAAVGDPQHIHTVYRNLTNEYGHTW